MISDESIVTVSGLGKGFGARAAVTGLCFTLSPGQILGLVGANGGGKTTTLRLLAGLIRADAGAGMILGKPLGRTDRRHIGYMTQQSALSPELTVRDHLVFRCAVFGLDQPAARVAALAEQYGLTDRLACRVDTLSGGWARRVHFAATVLHRPRLLLLDEPTAGLDVVTRRLIWLWLHQLAAQGAAIIIATHDLVDAEQCHAVLFYNDGRVAGPMTPAALITASGAADLETAVYRRSTGG